MKRISNLFCIIVSLLLIAANVSAEESVGSPKGTISVSHSGAAVYSMSFELPNGGTFSPQLGLSYNSQGGYGHAGYGFNVTGLSAITRGNRNMYYDCEVSSTDNIYDSAYYLDGKRLILKSGTDGEDGAIYTAEGDPYTEIILHLLSNSKWFEVKTSDGVIYKYGVTSNTRLSFYYNGNTRCVAWYIRDATDKYHNTINYHYTHNGLCLLPDYITYGRNTEHSRGIECRVDYTYTDIASSNVRSFKIMGAQGSFSKKLSEVSTKINNQIYRRYVLGYNETSDGSLGKFSRLTSITEYNGAGEHYPSVLIDWNFLQTPTTTCFDKSVSLKHRFHDNYYPGMVISLDVNGDGIGDIIRVCQGQHNDGTGQQFTFAYVARSSRTFDGEIIYPDTIRYDLPPYFSMGIDVGLGDVSCLDYDGDGLNDLVFPYYIEIGHNCPSNAHVCIIYGKDIKNGIRRYTSLARIGLAASTKPPLYVAVDMNGDGKSEVLCIEKQKNNSQKHVVWMISESGNAELMGIDLDSTPQKIYTGDYNNDGLTDIILLCENGYKIYYNNGYRGSFSNVFSDNNTTQGVDFTDSWRVNQGDFNGDGLIDFVCAKTEDGRLHIELNKGDGSFTHVVTENFGIYDHHDSNKDDGEYSFEVLDFDNDGRSDVFLSKAMFTYHNGAIWEKSYYRYNRTEIKLLKSTGENLTLYESYNSDREVNANGSYIFTGDFDGDGVLELANYGHKLNDNSSTFDENTIHLYKFGNSSPSSGKVSSVTDGFGVKTYISYSSATNPSVYTAGQSMFPLNSYTLPLSVVSGLRMTGTGISSRSVNYSYGDFRMHLGGKGALGFSTMTKTDNALGITERTYVDSWNTEYWIPSRTVQTKTIGSNTETTVSTNNIYSDIAPKNWYSFTASTRTTDLDGNITDSYNSLDNFEEGSHPSVQEVSYGNGSTYKKIQYSGYSNVNGMHLPEFKVSGQQYSNEEYVSSTTRYVYDLKGNPTFVSENYNTDHNLQKTYTYDVYGNVLSETVDGDDIATMTKYYQYDTSGRFVTRTYTIPSSVTKSYTYDIFGNLLSESDESNPSNILTDSHSYDGWGRKTNSILADGKTITYAYEWNSSVYGASYRTKVNTTNAPWTETYYDALGREICNKTIGLGGINIANYSVYDNKGQVSQKRSTEGCQEIIETFTYDNRGRVTSDIFSTGQQTEYSYGNRSVTVTVNGNSTTKNYDEWGNVISVSDPVSGVIYTYSSFGKPKEITSNSITLSLTYDEVGNRISMSDPSTGEIRYTYDALGRVISQTDARGVTTYYTYDALGRIESKEVGDETIIYTYGVSGNNKNQLVSVSSSTGTIYYTYDAFGNVTSKTRNMQGEAPLIFSYTYDDINRLDTQTYPDGFVTANKYTYTGNIWAVTDINRTSFFWAYSRYDGLTTKVCYGGEMYGCAPASISSAPIHIPHEPLDPVFPVDPVDPELPVDFFDPPGLTSLFEAIHNYSVSNVVQCNNQGLPTMQQLVLYDDLLAENTYTYRSSDGNLISRSLNSGATENFTYDSADRLTTVSVAGSQTMNMNYSANGNINYKTGIGYYDYAGDKPHAVTSVDNISGLISNTPQTITYNDFGKVSRIEEGDYVLQIIYGPDEERWKSVLYHNGNVVRSTVYFDDYESVTENGVTRNWHDLGNGALYLTDSNGNEMELVAFTDHQGSILKLVDLEGNVKFDACYDVWGRKTINLNLLSYYHGYTGHEMIPELALINMNGRFYDPLLARFLSPDNYVQEPDNSQNINRFSYCLNNPLKYTDPSGEIFWLIPAAVIVGSGAVNAIMNADNIHNVGHVFGYFCIGGLSGTVALLGGPVGMFASGALLGGGNSFLTQGITKGFGNVDWPGVANSALFAGATSCLSSAFGNYVSSVTGDWLNRIKDVTLRETLSGLVGGGITGAAMGAISDFNGADGSFWENVGKGAGFGALEGALGGFVKGRILQIQKKTELHRPYIREGVRKAVEETADRLPDGRFLDVNTGCPINGKYDLGHKRGFEYWKMKKWAESIGMSQKQFNDFMNNPVFYQIELPKLNRSHIFEYKGPTNINYFDYLR